MLKTLTHAHIRSLIDSSPDTKIRIHTYQGEESMKAYERSGYFTGHAPYIENDRVWCDAYRWMRDQMAVRIQNFSGDYPVWGWLKRHNNRQFPMHYTGSRESYRVTALVPRSRILFSQYDHWHHVLNNGAYTDTEREYDEFDKRFPGTNDSPEYLAAIEPTWHKIFDFPDPTGQTKVDIGWRGDYRRMIVQACIDRIQASDIVSIRQMNPR